MMVALDNRDRFRPIERRIIGNEKGIEFPVDAARWLRLAQIVGCGVVVGQAVGMKEVEDGIWLVRFMDYDLGPFDLDTRVLEPFQNPFDPELSPT